MWQMIKALWQRLLGHHLLDEQACCRKYCKHCGGCPVHSYCCGQC